jgi:hypothetical protein
MQNGKLMLSMNDAIALALENNLDIAISRYNLHIADTDVLRTKAGATLLGVNTGGPRHAGRRRRRFRRSYHGQRRCRRCGRYNVSRRRRRQRPLGYREFDSGSGFAGCFL